MPLRVLHLEDDPRDAQLVYAVLSSDEIDCEISVVETRDGFLKGLNGPLDLILADDNLPQFDGLSAFALAGELRPDVPFVFLSGTIGEEAAVDRLKAGATDVVVKGRMDRLPFVARRALAEAREKMERRKAEEEVLRLNADLEQRVAERTAALVKSERRLQVARLEAERANRAKSQFLSRMSHDLRTPLNAILGFAQLLELDTLSEDGRESVGQIMRGGGHLLELINEVLDITRIEAGHLSLSLESVNTVEAVNHAVDLVRPLAAQRGIEIEVGQPPSPDLQIHADRSRFAQILLNLLSNAVKYNRQNGRVTVWFEPVPEARLRVKVTDTGAGIPAGKLALLFNPFERLGAEQSDVEGTGLGLALARRLAEAMGGSVGVVSQVDRGSTFWIELALGDGVAATVEAPRTAPAHNYHETNGVVLYVEDNLSNVRLMERVLMHRPGVRLVHAPKGEDGLRLARDEHPGLIFLDLHLPDMSGEEVLRQLWEDPQIRNIPVAVLSADATPGHMRRLLASGAVEYLTKPLNITRVMNLLDERLHRSEGL